MPGAQSRRAPVARVSATARRGANVPAGVPGVYRVPRSRVRVVQSDAGLAGRNPNPWIQPADYEVTVNFANSGQWEGATPVVAAADYSDAELAGWLAENTAELAAGVWFKDSPGGSTGTHDLTIVRTTPDDHIQHFGTFQPLRAGVATLNPPPPDLPDGATDYDQESDQGRLVGDVVAEIAYTAGGSPTPDVGGSLWWTLEDDDPFRTVSTVHGYTPVVSFGEESGTHTLTVPPSTFGVDPSEVVLTDLWLYGLTEAIESPGTGARTATSPGSASYAMTFTATLTYTIRPPRVRFIYPDPSAWTVNDSPWTGYIWDAGLYLGATYEDIVSGLPGVPPTGCDTLSFYVVAPGDNFPTGSYDAFALVDDLGFFEAGATGPATADSHLWVVWQGPAFDPDIDPPPGVSPASLVPASLAENGEG